MGLCQWKKKKNNTQKAEEPMVNSEKIPMNPFPAIL